MTGFDLIIDRLEEVVKQLIIEKEVAVAADDFVLATELRSLHTYFSDKIKRIKQLKNLSPYAKHNSLPQVTITEVSNDSKKQ